MPYQISGGEDNGELIDLGSIVLIYNSVGWIFDKITLILKEQNINTIILDKKTNTGKNVADRSGGPFRDRCGPFRWTKAMASASCRRRSSTSWVSNASMPGAAGCASQTSDPDPSGASWGFRLTPTHRQWEGGVFPRRGGSKS